MPTTDSDSVQLIWYQRQRKREITLTATIVFVCTGH